MVEFFASEGWDEFQNALEDDYDLYVSPGPVIGYNQVCIGISKKLNYKYKSVKTLDISDHFKPEFLQVDIELEEKILTIIGTRIKSQKDYITKKNTKEKQLEFLKDHIKNIDNEVICLGDYNFTQGYISNIFGAIADCWGPRINNDYYSYAFNKDDHIGLDWLLTKKIKDVFNGYEDKGKSPFATYDWKFIDEIEDYGDHSKDDYLGIDGLPDHAILKGMISLE